MTELSWRLFKMINPCVSLLTNETIPHFRLPRTDPGKCFAEKNHVCLVLKTSERGGRLFEIGVVQW